MFAVIGSELWGIQRLSGLFTMVNVVAIPGAFASGPAIGGIVQAQGGIYNAAIATAAASLWIAWLTTLCMSTKPAPPLVMTPAAPTSAPTSAPQPDSQPLEQDSASAKVDADHPQGASQPLLPHGPTSSSSKIDHLVSKDGSSTTGSMDAHEKPSSSSQQQQKSPIPCQDPRYDEYTTLLNAQHIDLNQVTESEREQYIKVVQLVKFREKYPDVPEDLFPRAVQAVKENPFDVIRQKVYDKFGAIPNEWNYQDIDLA